jgi:choloylglycine hydrolase
MCTAVSYIPNDHYFGRNLDLEKSFGEAVTITPRKYPFLFRNGTEMPNHYAMIGMAAVKNNYPLYFDATNEKGLSIAGLNFPGNAVYHSFEKSKCNIAPFELIPWLLGSCANVQEARNRILSMSLWDESFNHAFPNTPLHWLISDKSSSLVAESTAYGLMVYDNPVGVLTNSPPFPYHLHNLSNYMQLTPQQPTNRQPISFSPYSLGLGAFGLPGDLSSSSRFVKAAFTKMHSKCDDTEMSAIMQFFHILDSVAQPRGCTQLPTGEFEITQYSSCCNTAKGIYYYKTYANSTISAVSLKKSNLDGNHLSVYPLIREHTVVFQN